MFTNFASNMIINYGNYITIWEVGGGCGLAKNIKLYPNFSFIAISDIDPYQFMKNEAKF